MLNNPDFYKDVLENLFDGVYFVDSDRRITYWNKGAEIISGYKASQVVGRHCRDNMLNHVLANGMELCTDHCPLSATMQDGKRREAEVFLHHSDGHRVPVIVRASPIYNDEGQVIGAVETFSDNTEHLQTRRKNEQLQEIAHTDPLTGCSNRRHVETRLRAELMMYQESGTTFGVLFCDIDHFKIFNDTYGHDLGDSVLRMVSDTFRSNVRASDIVGRWGGEEFVIILHNITEQGMQMVAAKLLNLVSQSGLDNDGKALKVTVSMGCTLVGKEDTIESIINRADQLMYSSKSSGRNRLTLG